MGLSATGEAVLLAREGRVLRAYRDSQGIWTIGAGVTTASGLIRVVPGLVLTSAECDALNAKAFAQYAAHVDRALSGTWVEQHVYDALVSFCYNVGPGGFRKSTCLKRVKAGDLAGAKSAMLWWNKPAAIIGRRQAEADQLVTPYEIRLPSAVAGRPPVRAGKPLPAPSGPRVPVVRPPLPALRPARAPDFALPAWMRAVGAFIDAVFAPKPALRAY